MVFVAISLLYCTCRGINSGQVGLNGTGFLPCTQGMLLWVLGTFTKGVLNRLMSLTKAIRNFLDRVAHVEEGDYYCNAQRVSDVPLGMRRVGIRRDAGCSHDLDHVGRCDVCWYRVLWVRAEGAVSGTPKN